MALTDRASLLRAFFRLVNADSSDADLTEHDNSTLEGAYLLLQGGLDDAQQFLIDQGAEELWQKTTSALSVTGSDPTRYADLPSDFLRLNGDDVTSALWHGNGYRWGRLINPDDRFRRVGNFYYVRGNEGDSGNEGQKRIYFTVGAAVPTSTFADYIYRLPTLADGTTVDFPVDDRALIPAFAAIRATGEDWYVGDAQDEARLVRHLDSLKTKAVRRARTSRKQKIIQTAPVWGERWYI